MVLVPMYVSTLDRPFAIKTLSTCNSGDHNGALRNRRQSRFHTSSCMIRRTKDFCTGSHDLVVKNLNDAFSYLFFGLCSHDFHDLWVNFCIFEVIEPFSCLFLVKKTLENSFASCFVWPSKVKYLTQPFWVR